MVDKNVKRVEMFKLNEYKKIIDAFEFQFKINFASSGTIHSFSNN